MEACQDTGQEEKSSERGHIGTVCKYCLGIIPSSRQGKECCDHLCEDAYREVRPDGAKIFEYQLIRHDLLV